MAREKSHEERKLYTELKKSMDTVKEGRPPE